MQLFHLQRSRMQIIALLRVVRDQQHGAAGGAGESLLKRALGRKKK